MEYLNQAVGKAMAIGFREVTVDSLQLMGEMAPDFTRGVDLLSRVVTLRKELGDDRGEAKTLNDLSRLRSGLEDPDGAWKHYQDASAVVATFASKVASGAASDDVRGGLVTTLKSLITTRTELPFLGHFLELDRLLVLYDPSWNEGDR